MTSIESLKNSNFLVLYTTYQTFLRNNGIWYSIKGKKDYDMIYL